MMEKIKHYWLVFTITVAGIVALAIYTFSKNRKESQSLIEKAALAETQKQADLIEIEIKERLTNVDINVHEIQDLQLALDELDIRRQELKERESKLTDKEVEEFWSKK